MLDEVVILRCYPTQDGSQTSDLTNAVAELFCSRILSASEASEAMRRGRAIEGGDEKDDRPE